MDNKLQKKKKFNNVKRCIKGNGKYNKNLGVMYTKKSHNLNLVRNKYQM